MEVFVRLAGFGVRILPDAPFAITRDEAGRVTVVAGTEQDRISSVDPDPPGRAYAMDACRVGPGPRLARWRLEVGGVYTVEWPEEVDVVSALDPEEPPFFMFRGRNGGLAYAQGPFAPGAAPAAEQMIGAGQSRVDAGETGSSRWIELAYEHGGERWRQRHYRRPLAGDVTIVLTTQARAGGARAFHRVVDRVVDSIRPYGSGTGPV